VIRRCEKEISLKELGIPSLDIRKTRGSALMLEVREVGKSEKE